MFRLPNLWDILLQIYDIYSRVDYQNDTSFFKSTLRNTVLKYIMYLRSYNENIKTYTGIQESTATNQV